MPRSRIFLIAWLLGVLCLACATPLLASGEISAQELHEKIKRGDNVHLIDLRAAFEHADFNLGGESFPYEPLDGLAWVKKIEEIKDKQESNAMGEIVLYHNTDSLSKLIQETMEFNGVKNVRILTGGVSAWRGTFGDEIPQMNSGAPISSPPPPAQPAPAQPSANTRANDTPTDEPMAASADDEATFEEDQPSLDDSGNDEALDEDGAVDDEDDAAAFDEEESEGDFVPEDDASDE